MTHDRGAAAGIGGAAALVLVGDIAYAASRWGGSSSRSFFFALAGVVSCWCVGGLLRLGRRFMAAALARSL